MPQRVVAPSASPAGTACTWPTGGPPSAATPRRWPSVIRPITYSPGTDPVWPQRVGVDNLLAPALERRENSMAFVCSATWTARPGKEDVVRGALAELAPAS